MKTLRFVRPLGLALFALLCTPLALQAIDCTTNLCGFSGGQMTGLRDTFVDALNAESIAGNKTWSGTQTFNANVELSGTTTVSGAVNMTSTVQIGGTTMSSTAEELDDVHMQIVIADLSTAATFHVVSHFAGDITDWYCVLEDAITGTGSVLTLSVNGQEVTSGGTLTVTIINSATGDIDLVNAITGSTTVAQGQLVSIATDGASSGAVQEMCTLILER